MLLHGPCLAQPPTANGAARVTDVEGRVHSGALSALSDTTLTVGSRVLRTADLLKLEFAGREIASPVDETVLLLANGDLIVGDPQSMDEDSIAIAWSRPPGRPAVRVPLETTRGIIFTMPDDLRARARLMSSLLDGPRSSDVLVLDNGDRLSGELVGIDRAAITLESPVGRTAIERKNLLGVGFNPEWISFPKVEGLWLLLELTDGSRLTAQAVAPATGGLLRLRAAFGPELTLPLAAVAEMRFLGGRAVYLSDLEPIEYRYTPYLSGFWELRRDRNVDGGPLRLRDVGYPKGLGLHSRSAVSYRLDGRYERFRATAGIDDVTAGRGSVVLAVELDGNRVFESQPVAGEAPPLAIGPIDVSDRERLTLIVEFGPFGDAADHADWCDAALIKPAE